MLNIDDTDDEASLLYQGYLTPPLSPTKTISTEEWSSPRTPGSPRRSRSCLFFRDINNVVRKLNLTPGSPLGKFKYNCSLEALSVPVLHAADRGPSSVQPDDDSPIKTQPLPTTDLPSPQISSSLVCLHTRSLSIMSVDSENDEKSSHPGGTHTPSPVQRSGPLKPRKCNDSFSSETLLEKPIHVPLESGKPPITGVRRSRPAVTEGLLASPRYSQTGTPDRFIAYRRPLVVARESFELNSPAERRRREWATNKGTQTTLDAFSHRLRRSDRMNEELRGLREAHSMISARTTATRRNVNFRRGSIPLSTRQISVGAVWNVGGPSAVSDTVVAVSTGRGRMLSSGTNAPLYKSAFLNRADPEAEIEAYAQRLALALDIDQTDRILLHSSLASSQKSLKPSPESQMNTAPDSAKAKSSASPAFQIGFKYRQSLLKLTQRTVLDAPELRDDFYCTLITYSDTLKCLAVGLGNLVHIWSEKSGVNTPESLNTSSANGTPQNQHVTCLSFSSKTGGQAILAVGRADGSISLWSPLDSEPRFDVTQPKPVSCASWRPTGVQRPSLRDRAMTVPTEELVIGDEVGHIYFYSVEWPSETQSALFGWHGAMTLLARLTVHSQQICGLAWSPDGELFASGGNDNSCNLFETKKVLYGYKSGNDAAAVLDVRQGPNGESIYMVSNRNSSVLHLTQSAAKHTWTLNAAVKAIAFCPWQRGLIAVGGGSNDRCIHFYHTRSGTCLATIDCAAQVTSLIWSHTRREIAATFGFAQPEHPYRIAVFAWPSCEQLVAIPWYDENRALCAVAYPGGPTRGAQADNGGDDGRWRGEDSAWSRRGMEEGCIVVAASDMAIRFHEIWSDRRGSVQSGGMSSNGAMGLLGGSDILEGPYARSIERQGAVIR